jgi:hypothetical protein
LKRIARACQVFGKPVVALQIVRFDRGYLVEGPQRRFVPTKRREGCASARQVVNVGFQNLGTLL